MSTRGNYIFTRFPTVEKDGERLSDPDAIKNLTVELSEEDVFVKNGYKIYIHSDNYPSFAIPNLFKFLNCDGAKARAYDLSYLSAWFVAYHAVNELLAFNVKKDDVSFEALGQFYRDYVPKGEDILDTNDFTGIGLIDAIDTGADYTYVIVPGLNSDNEVVFTIYVYDYNFKFVDVVHSDEDLEDVRSREWWD